MNYAGVTTASKDPVSMLARGVRRAPGSPPVGDRGEGRASSVGLNGRVGFTARWARSPRTPSAGKVGSWEAMAGAGTATSLDRYEAGEKSQFGPLKSSSCPRIRPPLSRRAPCAVRPVRTIVQHNASVDPQNPDLKLPLCTKDVYANSHNVKSEHE